MCGFIIIDKVKDSRGVLLAALNRLTSRGYDGIGYVVEGGPCNESAVIFDKSWIFRNLEECAAHISENPLLCDTSDKLIVLHTRWPTSGQNYIGNIQPIVSFINGTKLIVHNGTVDSVQYHSQYSDTRLLSFLSYNDIKEKLLLSEVKNSTMAVLTPDISLHVDKSKNLYVSPDKKIISSIPDPIFEKYNSAVVLNDISLRNLANIQLDKFQIIPNIEKLPPVTALQAYNGNFMFDEILSQSNIEIPSYKSKLQGNLIGCGSSYFAAMYASYKLPKRYTAFYATQAKYLRPHFRFDDVIAISQSGETHDVVSFMNTIKPTKSHLLTNNPRSLLALKLGTQRVYNMGLTEEVGVAATKTFLASCLNLTECDKTAKTFKFDVENLITSCDNYIDRRGLSFSKCVVLGNGPQYALAMEGALKMQEVANVPSMGMPAAEIKHGPLALIDNDTLCIFIIDSDEDLEQTLNNAYEAKCRNGKILLICNQEVFWKTEKHNRLRMLPLILYSGHDLHGIIPIQYLAYKKAIMEGLNPDKPHNITKIVTV